MMHLVRLTDSPEIGRICASQYLQSLMDEQVMHEEISSTIYCDPQTNAEQETEILLNAKHQTGSPRYGKNEEEEVILLEYFVMIHFVMILVQVP